LAAAAPGWAVSADGDGRRARNARWWAWARRRRVPRSSAERAAKSGAVLLRVYGLIPTSLGRGHIGVGAQRPVVRDPATCGWSETRAGVGGFFCRPRSKLSCVAAGNAMSQAVSLRS
jgi:hypothetical protein